MMPPERYRPAAASESYTGPRPATVEAQLGELTKADLIRLQPTEPEPAYVFKHALTQEAAYQSMLHSVRREVHRRVAQTYEQLYVDRLDEFAALLAYHYAQAGDDAETFVHAARAGDVAARHSAYTEAHAHYTSALNALAHLPDSVDNRRARVNTVLKETSVAWGIASASENLPLLFEAEAAAQTLPEQDRLSLARVQYWIGRVYSYSNEHRKAAQYYERVLTAAHETQDQDLLGLALALGARTYHMQGYFGKAVPLFEQAIPYLERSGDWSEWILAKVMLALSLAAQGHYREGREQGDEAVRKALAWHDRGSLAIAQLMSARVEFMAGDPKRFLDEIREEIKEAEATILLVYYMALGFRAWAESRIGMHETARATMAAADATASQFGTRLIFEDWFAAARAEIALNAGLAREAVRLSADAVDMAQIAGAVFSEGLAQRVWGQALAALNGPEDSQVEVHLEKSLELLEESQAVIEAARTHVAWGKTLMQRGDPQKAREHLEKAAKQFEATGPSTDLDDALNLLANLKANSRMA